MKGFDKTAGHTFEEPFISLHIHDAENGDYESALWLWDNLGRVMRKGGYIDMTVRFRIEQLRKGGLRRARQVKGNRGKRGLGMGEHARLRLAVEMRKEILAGATVRAAAKKVADRFCASPEAATGAYYEYKGTRELRVQISMDAI
jgi:hypothetical protein